MRMENEAEYERVCGAGAWFIVVFDPCDACGCG